MKYSSVRDVNEVVKSLVSVGFIVTGHKSHIKLRYRDSGTLTISKSPSCHHWKENVMKDAQRVMRRSDG